MGNKQKKSRCPSEIVRPQMPVIPSKMRTHEKKLIWPCFSYSETKDKFLGKFLEQDSDVFPGIEAVYQNYDIFNEAKEFINEGEVDFPGIGLGIKEFWDAFRQGQDILLADPHFSPIQYRRVLAILDDVLSDKDERLSKDIRIYGRNNIKNLVEYAKNKKKEYLRIHELFKLSIWALPGKKGTVHDRFAIMDCEIWHCGASICGMHGGLNAVSCGWIDKEGQLRNFFIKGGKCLHEL